MIVSVFVLGFYPDHGPKVLVRPLEAVKNLQIWVGLKLAVFFHFSFCAICYLWAPVSAANFVISTKTSKNSEKIVTKSMPEF